MLSHSEIKKRSKALSKAKTQLKKQFIGIDYIIDSLFEYVNMWYLAPEMLNRPVIINLWGMTGVGKTDLIRQMVKLLEYEELFLEIDLRNRIGWADTIAEALEYRGFFGGEHNILLFDEIQNFRTVDEDGKSVKKGIYTDLWELLSDGKLNKVRRYKRLSETIFNAHGGHANDEESREKHFSKKIGMYEALEIKELFGVEESAQTLANMTYKELDPIIQKLSEEGEHLSQSDFSKTLIIISGNLDEAYTMASQSSESDIDADIFRSFTENITVTDIKDALSKRFRPEQIARFGNSHLIYKSFSKSDYQELISAKVDEYIAKTDEELNINISIDDSVHEVIYANGVYPTQGVRPVLSSITGILQTHILPHLLNAFHAKADSMTFRYNEPEKEFIAEYKNEVEKTRFIGDIDRIKHQKTRKEIEKTACHEAGHALIYVLEFEIAPLQLKSVLASSDTAGFVFPHKIELDKTLLISQIRVLLAGMAAEEFYFSTSHIGIGHSSDLRRATELASRYYREYGFGGNVSQSGKAEGGQYHFRTDLERDDHNIETLISEQYDYVLTHFKAHKEMYHTLLEELIEKKSLTPLQITKLFRDSFYKCEYKDEKFVIRS